MHTSSKHCQAARGAEAQQPTLLASPKRATSCEVVAPSPCPGPRFRAQHGGVGSPLSTLRRTRSSAARASTALSCAPCWMARPRWREDSTRSALLAGGPWGCGYSSAVSRILRRARTGRKARCATALPDRSSSSSPRRIVLTCGDAVGAAVQGRRSQAGGAWLTCRAAGAAPSGRSPARAPQAASRPPRAAAPRPACTHTRTRRSQPPHLQCPRRAGQHASSHRTPLQALSHPALSGRPANASNPSPPPVHAHTPHAAPHAGLGPRPRRAAQTDTLSPHKHKHTHTHARTCASARRVVTPSSMAALMPLKRSR